MNNLNMKDLTLEQYTKALAGKEAVPSGGGTCAVGGAFGVSLGGMVCSLTMGKKKYAAYEDEVQKIFSRLNELQNEMLLLVGKDAEAFLPLAVAYRLPNKTEQQAAEKEKAMENGLFSAMQVPFIIIEKALEGLSLLEELEGKSSRLAISDIGVGASFLRAAAEGAALNVYVNTQLMKDRKQAAEMNRKTRLLCEEAVKKAEEICLRIEEVLTEEKK